jgi:hypothetical protein
MAERKASTTRKTSTTTRAKKPAQAEAPVKVPETPVEEPKTFSEEQVKAMIAEALQAQNEAFARQMDATKPQVIQVAPETEKVVMRFQAEVADDNEAVFGEGGYFGKIVGKRGILTIPKTEFVSRFRDMTVQWMLENRWLIVLSGLTEDERELYGVNYKPGEVLDDKAFTKMLDMTDEELLEIFPGLCPQHREMVAKRLATDYFKNGPRPGHYRDFITTLNNISKKDYMGLPDNDPRRKGAFAPILEDLNSQSI